MTSTTQKPRVRCISKSRNTFHGTYRRHTIELDRKSRREEWYVRVWGEDGIYAADGYWRDSHGKTIREAILHALEGSLLWKRPAP